MCRTREYFWTNCGHETERAEVCAMHGTCRTNPRSFLPIYAKCNTCESTGHPPPPLHVLQELEAEFLVKMDDGRRRSTLIRERWLSRELQVLWEIPTLSLNQHQADQLRHHYQYQVNKLSDRNVMDMSGRGEDYVVPNTELQRRIRNLRRAVQLIPITLLHHLNRDELEAHLQLTIDGYHGLSNGERNANLQLDLDGFVDEVQSHPVNDELHHSLHLIVEPKFMHRLGYYPEDRQQPSEDGEYGLDGTGVRNARVEDYKSRRSCNKV